MSEDVRIGDINVNVAEEILLHVTTTPEGADMLPNSSSEINSKTGSMFKSSQGGSPSEISADRAMTFEKVISLRDKEIMALRNNASLLEEKVALLETASKTNDDKVRMKEVELEFMHKENDRIRLENERETTLLSSKIEMLKNENTFIKDQKISEIQDMKTKLACETGKTIALSEKLGDAALLSERTMLAFNTQQDLVAAKQEIIENLKKEIENITQSHKFETKKDSSVVTSNLESITESEAQDMVPRKKIIELAENYDAKIKLMCEESNELRAQLEEANAKLIDQGQKEGLVGASKGTEETYEFIKVHGTNGVVMNSFLLWANIQRVTRPEKAWKDEALTKFLKEEITEAKECLWRISGDKIETPLKKRQGASKSNSEINDISGGLKTLAENECLPMFLATSDMVKETPLYNTSQDENDHDKEMKSRLMEIERSMKAMLDNNVETVDEQTSKLEANTKTTEDTNMISYGKTNDQKDGEDENSNKKSKPKVSWAQEDDVYLSESEDDVPKEQWSVAGESSKSKRRTWKDKLNILKGTLSSDNSDAPQPADVHLVAYGFGTDTSGEQIKQWLKSNGIWVKNCNLLTTFEGARSHTFKLVVKATDYEKTTNPAIWPENVGVRKFKFFRPKKGRSGGGNQDKKLNSGGPNVIVHPEHANNENQRQRSQHNGIGYSNTRLAEKDSNRLWNPPTKELLMQYQKRFGPIGPPGNPPLQPQNVWQQPNRGMLQNNQKVQNEWIRKTQPQVKILQRNGNNLSSSQFNQQIMQPDDLVMAGGDTPVFSLTTGDDWSMGYQTQQ